MKRYLEVTSTDVFIGGAAFLSPKWHKSKMQTADQTVADMFYSLLPPRMSSGKPLCIPVPSGGIQSHRCELRGDLGWPKHCLGFAVVTRMGHRTIRRSWARKLPFCSFVMGVGVAAKVKEGAGFRESWEKCLNLPAYRIFGDGHLSNIDLWWDIAGETPM